MSGVGGRRGTVRCPNTLKGGAGESAVVGSGTLRGGTAIWRVARSWEWRWVGGSVGSSVEDLVGPLVGDSVGSLVVDAAVGSLVGYSVGPLVEEALGGL